MKRNLILAMSTQFILNCINSCGLVRRQNGPSIHFRVSLWILKSSCLPFPFLLEVCRSSSWKVPQASPVLFYEPSPFSPSQSVFVGFIFLCCSIGSLLNPDPHQTMFVHQNSPLADFQFSTFFFLLSFLVTYPTLCSNSNSSLILS